MKGKGKGSPYSIAERRVPELIPVLGRQPAGDGRGERIGKGEGGLDLDRLFVQGRPSS